MAQRGFLEPYWLEGTGPKGSTRVSESLCFWDGLSYFLSIPKLILQTTEHVENPNTRQISKNVFLYPRASKEKPLATHRLEDFKISPTQIQSLSHTTLPFLNTTGTWSSSQSSCHLYIIPIAGQLNYVIESSRLRSQQKDGED